MTDEQIDRSVRAADPYAQVADADFGRAERALLEEILTAAPGSEHDLGRRRAWRRPVAGALVAAAALAVAISVPALRDEPAPGGNGHTVQVGGGSGQVVYAAAAIEVAEDNPRLLIDEPGWKATTVYDFAKDSGTIVFKKGRLDIEMNWYPADRYQDYYDDRTEVSKRDAITIDGQPGSRVSYGPTEIAAMLEPEGPTFVEIRAARFEDADDILATFAKIKHVDVDTWLAALPAEIVTPGKVAEVADEILADIPLAPGFDKGALTELGVNDRYQFGAEAVSLVVCSWLDEWLRAVQAVDAAAEQRVVRALGSARSWSVLDEMQKTGEYSPGVWELADKVNVADDPRKYQENFQCSGVD